jgi:hypothetical protein
MSLRVLFLFDHFFLRPVSCADAIDNLWDTILIDMQCGMLCTIGDHKLQLLETTLSCAGVEA